MREWSIRIFVLGPGGEELPAVIFDKVTYKLHPTFTNPTRGAYIPSVLRRMVEKKERQNVRIGVGC